MRGGKSDAWRLKTVGAAESNFLETATSGSWQDGDALSKTYWARFIWTAENGGGGTIMSKWQGGANRSMLMDWGGSQYDFNVLGNNITGYSALGSALQRIPKGKPCCVAGIVEQGNSIVRAYTQRAWVSGSYLAGALQQATFPLQLGKINDYGSNFNGQVLEWAVWTGGSGTTGGALSLPELIALEEGESPMNIRRQYLAAYCTGDSKGRDLTMNGRHFTPNSGAKVYPDPFWQDDQPLMFQGRAGQGLIKYLASVAQAQVGKAASVPNASAKKIASVQNV